MEKHSFKEWFAATRYWSFVVSTMPVLATAAWLFSRHALTDGWRSVLILVLCLLGVVVLHAAGNLLSDYYDYKTGVDNENAFAIPNLVFHQFEPKSYFIFSMILFVVGIVIGLIITYLSGVGLLLVGGLGVLLTLLYSYLKYHALGDLDIFLIFGVLAVLGTAYALTGRFCPEALVVAVPVGLITVSVLHANNTYDIPSDGQAGIKTFAMILGGKASSVLYRCYLALPFLCVVISVICGWMHPLALLCLAAIVPAWKNQKQASTFDAVGLEAMKGLDQGSAKLQMVFSLLLSLGLFIGGLL